MTATSLKNQWATNHGLSRRARKRKKPQDRITANLQWFRCAYCLTAIHEWRRNLDYNVDHFMPKAMGASDYHKNLFICCIDCNHAKGNMCGLKFISIVFSILEPTQCKEDLIRCWKRRRANLILDDSLLALNSLIFKRSNEVPEFLP